MSTSEEDARRVDELMQSLEPVFLAAAAEEVGERTECVHGHLQAEVHFFACEEAVDQYLRAAVRWKVFNDRAALDELLELAELAIVGLVTDGMKNLHWKEDE